MALCCAVLCCPFIIAAKGVDLGGASMENFGKKEMKGLGELDTFVLEAGTSIVQNYSLAE